MYLHQLYCNYTKCQGKKSCTPVLQRNLKNVTSERKIEILHIFCVLLYNNTVLTYACTWCVYLTIILFKYFIRFNIYMYSKVYEQDRHQLHIHVH